MTDLLGGHVDTGSESAPLFKQSEGEDGQPVHCLGNALVNDKQHEPEPADMAPPLTGSFRQDLREPLYDEIRLKWMTRLFDHMETVTEEGSAAVASVLRQTLLHLFEQRHDTTEESTQFGESAPDLVIVGEACMAPALAEDLFRRLLKNGNAADVRAVSRLMRYIGRSSGTFPYWDKFALLIDKYGSAASSP
jgi:hypothetical protein